MKAYPQYLKHTRFPMSLCKSNNSCTQHLPSTSASLFVECWPILCLSVIIWYLVYRSIRLHKLRERTIHLGEKEKQNPGHIRTDQTTPTTLIIQEMPKIFEENICIDLFIRFCYSLAPQRTHSVLRTLLWESRSQVGDSSQSTKTHEPSWLASNTHRPQLSPEQ